MNRRKFIAVGAGAGAAGLISAKKATAAPSDNGATKEAGVARGKAGDSPAAFKHSVTRWPYPKFTVDQLSQMARELGLDSVELLEPDDRRLIWLRHWLELPYEEIGAELGLAPDAARMRSAIERCAKSEDYREGRRAFMEKRKPRFTGR